MDFATDYNTLQMINSQGYNGNYINSNNARMADASLFAGLGNIFLAPFENAMQQEEAARARRFQREENQKNRDYLTEMWNKQNEYNTPTNQRKLLEDAGYNPFVLQQNGSTSSAGAAGSPSMSPAPNMARVQFPDMLGVSQSIQGSMALAQGQQRVDSDVALQRSQILKNYSEMLIKSFKEAGPEGYKQMWKELEPMFSDLDFFNSPAYVQTMEELDKIRIENDANSLRKSLLEKYGDKEYQKKFEQIDQLISESASKIQLMATQGHVNEGTVWKMGYEVGKLLAESNYLGVQATQISTLLPYMVTKMSNEATQSGYLKDIARYNSNMVGMDFLEREAVFAGNKQLRDLLHTDRYQSAMAWKAAVNENHVMTFVKGVGSALGSVMNPLKFTPLMQGKTNQYFFQPELNVGQ